MSAPALVHEPECQLLVGPQPRGSGVAAFWARGSAASGLPEHMQAQAAARYFVSKLARFILEPKWRWVHISVRMYVCMCVYMTVFR